MLLVTHDVMFVTSTNGISVKHSARLKFTLTDFQSAKFKIQSSADSLTTQ